MNRSHIQRIDQLAAEVHGLRSLGAPITVLDIDGRRAAGEITAIDDRGFTVRDLYGDEHEFEYAELESVGTYNP